MFTLALFELLGSPTSNISGEAVKFFCRLIADIDLTKPRSLGITALARRYHLPWAMVGGCIEELREAGVLEVIGEVQHTGDKGMQAGSDGSNRSRIYQVKPEWLDG